MSKKKKISGVAIATKKINKMPRKKIKAASEAAAQAQALRRFLFPHASD